MKAKPLIDKSVQCLECGKKYTSRAILIKHNKWHKRTMNKAIKLKQDMKKYGDTNTLREEWKTYAYNDPTPENIATDEQALDYIADYWLNKFNQKLEEIEEEIENLKEYKPSKNTSQDYKNGIQVGFIATKKSILQIIKNKKN